MHPWCISTLTCFLLAKNEPSALLRILPLATSAANSQNRLGRGQFFTLDDTVVGNVKKIEVAVSLPDWL